MGVVGDQREAQADLLEDAAEEGARADDEASAATEEDIGPPDEVDLMDDDLFAVPSGEAEENPATDTDTLTSPMVARDTPSGSRAPRSPLGAAPLVVAPPPPPPAPRRFRPEGHNKAMFVLCVPGGKLIYYGGQHENMVAECQNPAHGRCVKTKTVRKPKRRTTANVGQGRPLGLLAAWLSKGQSLQSKEEHWSKGHMPSREDRLIARQAIKDMEGADAEGLLAAEADQGEGEDSEPDRIEF